MRKNYDSSKSDRKKSRKLNKGSKMIIHTKIKYSILFIIPLILLILLPTVSAAKDNRISNENSKSIEALKQAIIRIKPDYALAHYNLGVAYAKSGKYKEAIEAYKQAIRINPDYAKAHSNLGNAYVCSGMYYKEAIEAYKQAITIKPDYALAHYNLGNAYDSSGMYKEAIEAYKQAIRTKPDDEDAHHNLGLTYAFLNDRDSATAHYKILISLDSERANELYNMIYK